MATLARLLVLAATATAHFTLTYPLTSGFDDDKEGTGPCGSFKPDFTKTTDFHVGGENIAVDLFHPQANWLFRGTLDVTGESNWTALFPIVQQSGQAKFCEPNITTPASWAGQKGVIGIVADGPDGILYQCAAVNFVTGMGTMQKDCTNGTLQASFTSDSQLPDNVGTGSSSSSGSSSASGSPTAGGSGSSSSSSSSSPSSSQGAAAGRVGATNWGLLAGGLVTPLVMAALGAALMI